MAPAPALVGIEGGKKPGFIVKSENWEMMEATSTAVCVEPLSWLKNENDVNDQEELDVVDCSGSTAGALVKEDDPDATECSSSFGDTFSGPNCESKQDLSDAEVDSPLFVPNNSPVVPDGFNSVFKKKKVTAHWRKFISPLMWRCQWLELRMKELLSQALKYDKELAFYKHEKEVLSKMVELNSSVSRSVPMAFQSHPKGNMRRRKRKRNEEGIDMSLYESNHVIFSYYEDKKTEKDGHSIDDDCGTADENIKGNVDGDWLVGLKSSDSCIDEILSNIEILQSKVFKLKSHLSKVICKNSREISSCPGDLLSGCPPGSYANSVSDSPVINGDTTSRVLCTPPHNESECEMEEVVMPESAVSSYGDAADLDITGGDFSLLCVNDLLSQQHILDFWNDVEDDILIDNHEAEVDYQLSRTVEKVPGLVKEEELETQSGDESTTPEISMLEHVASKKVSVSQQAVLKPCNSGKKRGRPKKKRRGGGSVAASVPLRSERLRKRRKLAGKRT